MPVNSFRDHPLSWTPPAGVVSAKPIYLALAAALESDILAGTLPSGTKLPPQRELADFLDLDFTTVTRAYTLCREKGLIHGVTGRGTFVSSPDPDETDARVFDAGVVQGFPETGAGEIAAAARAVLARPSAAHLFSYRHRDGTPAALAAARMWLERCGVVAGRGQAAIFPGAQGALSAVLLSLFRPGDAVAVDRYTYANFISLARLAHLKLIPVPADTDGMCPDALAAVAADARLKGVFLMPHAANPTGLTLSEARKDALADVVARRRLLLIEDEARLLPRSRGDRPLCARVPDQAVYIAGSTRHVAPGLRATFMAFPASVTRRLLNALHHLTIKAGALDAEILAELVRSGRAARILAMKAERARAAHAVFDAVFPSAPAAAPDALFRVLPLPGTAGRGRAVEDFCRAGGVAVCHSDRFSVSSGQADAFLRVSVSSAATPARLRRGLARLASLAERCGTLGAS